MTPKERAKQSAKAMWAEDWASQTHGFVLHAVDEGSATLSVDVAARHANGHGICHGGVIYSLADSAFAYACNSRNQNTLAQHCVITYVTTAGLGDRLIATATEISTRKRNGIYDVKVTNQKNEIVAEFRGFSRTIAGSVFQE